MMLRIVSNIRTEKILLNFQNIAYIKYAQIYNKSQINSGRKKKILEKIECGRKKHSWKAGYFRTDWKQKNNYDTLTEERMGKQ